MELGVLMSALQGNRKAFGVCLGFGDILQPRWASENPVPVVCSCQSPLPITHTPNTAQGQPCRRVWPGLSCSQEHASVPWSRRPWHRDITSLFPKISYAGEFWPLDLAQLLDRWLQETAQV